jgi:sulfoxide reductase heme-binding subunit YedZ
LRQTDVTGDYIKLKGDIMTHRRLAWFEGFRLLTVLSATLLMLCIAIAGMRHFEVDGIRKVIQFTARSSLLLFCVAMSASALLRLMPSAGTRWIRRNRRMFGLSFAVSHGLHAVAIACFAAMAPAAFSEATSSATFIFGSIGYALIVAMAATSFDRSAAMIGPRAWRILHAVGTYYLWFQFCVSFGMRIPQMPNYAWFLVPLMIAMTIRITAMLRDRPARALPAK